MNKELLRRIQTAGEYQRKAVYALFPEEMSGHLEVIEKELKMMALEAVMAFLENNDSGENEASKNNVRYENKVMNHSKCYCNEAVKHNSEKAESGGRTKKVRKVEITT